MDLRLKVVTENQNVDESDSEKEQISQKMVDVDKMLQLTDLIGEEIIPEELLKTKKKKKYKKKKKKHKGSTGQQEEEAGQNGLVGLNA